MEGEEKKVGCSGRCEHCNVNQRTYCASQMAFYAQQEIAEIKAMLASFGRPKEEGEEVIVVLREEEKVEEEEIIEEA